MGGIKAEETLRIARTTIYYWLNFLKDEGMIDIKKTNKYTIITIQNWDEYQNVDIKKTSNVTSDGHQMDTNKNIKKDKNINIYTYWNGKGIIVHRNLTEKINRKINGSLKDYTESEILQAISNYDLILKSNEYFWTHVWSLEEFLQRGIEKFLDLEIAKNNYRNKNGNGNNENMGYTYSKAMEINPAGDWEKRTDNLFYLRK